MAEIAWQTPANGKAVKASSFRATLILLASTFFACMKDPTQAAFLVQQAIETATENLRTRHREEEDKSDANELKWAWWRLLWDTKNLRVLRAAIYEQAVAQPAPLGTALQDLARMVELVIQEADAANAKAPQLNPRPKREDEALPNMDVPEPPAMPKNINYRAIINE